MGNQGFGRKIDRLMRESGIKSAAELAEHINQEAGRRIVSPSSVTKWLSDKTQPKATSLMFLAKALKVTADIILFDEGSNPQHQRELTKMVTEIAQVGSKTNLTSEFVKFLSSDKISDEEKKVLIIQIKWLVESYENKQGGAK